MRERDPNTRNGHPSRHGTPAVGFEMPLHMLAACHGRSVAQCASLKRLVEHLCRHEADRPAQEAAAAVMRHFDTAAVHHHADEEMDLFPALIESMAGSDAVCLRELTASLTAEHRELERRWRALRLRLEQMAGGQAATLPSEDVDEFIDRYERHIAREEAELLPMAGRLLGDAEVARIGLAMRARRGDSEPAALPRSSAA